MNELQVTVQQTPGIIRWNFEELKTELAAQMDEYKTIVYTDENISDAKKDVAALRKLEKAVDTRRIEIKNKCLEPYQEIEAQAKELKGLINEPIQVIAAKVDDYETRRKAAKKEKIMKTMDDAFAELPEDIRNRLKCKIYDTRWENAGTAEKVYKDAIHSALSETRDALRLIADIDEDFQDQVMEIYKTDLNMTTAMMKANEFKKQKEILLEREREKKEQERIRLELEERRKAEEAERSLVSQNVPTAQQEQRAEECEAVEEKTEQQAVAKPDEGQKTVQEPKQKIYLCMLKMRGTAASIQSAIDYARKLGVECEVQKP